MSSHADRAAARRDALRQIPGDHAMHAKCLGLAAAYRVRIAAGEIELQPFHAWAMRQARVYRFRLSARRSPLSVIAEFRTHGSPFLTTAPGYRSWSTQPAI